MSRFLVALMLLVAAIVVAGQSSSNEETPECPVNQVWSLCGRMCEPSCTDPKPDPRFCPAIQCTQFTVSCRCQKGYLRDNNNDECVKPEQCSA